MSALKRFYRSAEARDGETGFGVFLDARRLRTPDNAVAALPTRALAEAVAREWDAQGETIDTSAMPLTRLSFVALDKTEGRRADLIADLGKYAETDLICHRAASPETLIRRQSETWNPWLDWAKARYAFAPEVVAGIVAATPHLAGIAALKAHAAALDAFRLTALSHGVGLTGSAVLGLALIDAAIGAEAAFAAAALDDLFQIETWGEDAEARARLDRLAKDIADLAEFIAALG
ncbi:MAG: ATPase [Alphaproteobacteria bacterium]|nr:ATPase [Alphaproteobacteria bacterium]